MCYHIILPGEAEGVSHPSWEEGAVRPRAERNPCCRFMQRLCRLRCPELISYVVDRISTSKIVLNQGGEYRALEYLDT